MGEGVRPPLLYFNPCPANLISVARGRPFRSRLFVKYCWFVLAKSYGGISRIICVLKKFDRSGGRVNFRNISFVVNFESEVKGVWIRFGGRNFQRCSIPILLFLFQVRFEFDCHSTTLEYIYIYR